MSDAGAIDDIPGVIPKPPGTREFTLRAVIAGMVVAAIMGASYPYVVLKLGFGPNVSVVAAFFGYLALGIIFRSFNRWENNIVQTAGTSAAQTAFMCISLAAFDLLRQSPTLGYTFSPTPFQSFLWLAAASILGLLLAVPLRRHYVVDEKLTYPDGVAAAQTIIVLDARGKEARNPALALAIGTVISGLLMFLQQPWGGHLIPEIVFPTMLGLTAATAGAGVAVSLLAVGSGMIVGTRITTSMLLGAVLSWIIAPKFLVAEGIIAAPLRADILRWVMWPGTAMIICAGLTALALKWRTLARTFSNLSRGAVGSDEFPLRWVVIGVVLASVALVFIQIWAFGLAWWMPLLAVLLSVPLMLVGLRVLGETNWGPISQLTNLMQAIFAGVAPGNVTVNLATSGTTGTIAVQSEAIMQDYKAGHIIGSTPRFLTYAQLIAAPIGAAAVAWMYPLLRDTYGIGGEGLSSPISQRVAGFAEFLVQGGAALAAYAGEAAILFGILGILMTVFEDRFKRFMPSPTAIGIGMMVPGFVIFTMFIGGMLLLLWRAMSPRSAQQVSVPFATGMIAGEAIVAVLIPLLIAVGILSL
ncbi:MAG TPA: OPT/YSL family transporter [Kofleriaceae bacterium]|nr:OPT/YSL family transporter [Kofleriaceae bacterium]